MPDKEPIKVISDSKDQWLYQGDCKKCRRAPYCKKPCKPCKTRIQDHILNNPDKDPKQAIIDAIEG